MSPDSKNYKICITACIAYFLTIYSIIWQIISRYSQYWASYIISTLHFLNVNFTKRFVLLV